MSIDGKLLLAIVETIAFFSILGWAADCWIRSRLVLIYPIFGIIVFGSTIIPIAYLMGRYNLGVVIAACSFVIVAGAIKTFLSRKNKRRPMVLRQSTILLSVCIFFILLLSVVQASKYAIPGGIDSAVHSNIIQGSLVQTNFLQGTYPLGMHITIVTIERLFNTSQEVAFLSLYILLYVSTILGISVIADKVFKSTIASYVALLVATVDVSTYNNLLNGSGTHLIGTAFITYLVLGTVLLQKKPFIVQVTGQAILLTIIWYFHYPTIFFALPALWGWRIVYGHEKQSKYLYALIISLIVSLPLHVRLLHDPSYVKSIVPGIIAIVVVEAILFFFSSFISRIIRYRWLLLVLITVSAWMFYTYSSSFLSLPTWYGGLLLVLSVIGLVSTIFSRSNFGLFALLYFFGISFFDAFLHIPNIPKSSSIMIELVYYYGYTICLIFLGVSGLNHLLLLKYSRKLRSMILALSFIYLSFIWLSRSFDKIFIEVPGDHPVSRYGSSQGFGVFYTKNDIALATWVKQHVPTDGTIANPGGLYNTWATLSEHEILFAAYNVPTINDTEPVFDNLYKLLQGKTPVDVDYLIKRRVKYVLIPEQYAIAIYHPRAKLLHKEGDARFYELVENDLKSTTLTLPIGISRVNPGIQITSSGAYSCRYCDNRFYFTQADLLKELILQPGNTVEITIAPSLQDRTIEFMVDRTLKPIEVKTQGDIWVTTTNEVVKEITLPKNQAVSITLRNSNSAVSRIRAMALRQL